MLILARRRRAKVSVIEADKTTGILVPQREP
jgi:hypothetical protein